MVGTLETGVHQETHGGDHRHMEGTVHQGDRRAKGRCVQMVSGNQQADDVEEFGHLPREFASGGFLVQLLHDFMRFGFQLLLGILVYKFMFCCRILVSSIIDVFLFHQNTSFSRLPD